MLSSLRVCRNPHPNPSPSRPGSYLGTTGNGGAEASKAQVRSHTLLQPDRPGAVRPLFPCRRLACLASCELHFPAWAQSCSWRFFLRGCFPGAGSDLGGPTHRGRQNHMDRSMLCRRALVNLISQEHSWLLQRHLCA